MYQCIHTTYTHNWLPEETILLLQQQQHQSSCLSEPSLYTESHRHHIQPFPICLICFSSVPTLPHDWHGTAGSTVSSREACLTVERLCFLLLGAFLVWYVTEQKIHFEIWTFYKFIERYTKRCKNNCTLCFWDLIKVPRVDWFKKLKSTCPGPKSFTFTILLSHTLS